MKTNINPSEANLSQDIINRLFNNEPNITNVTLPYYSIGSNFDRLCEAIKTNIHLVEMNLPNIESYSNYCKILESIKENKSLRTIDLKVTSLTKKDKNSQNNISQLFDEIIINSENLEAFQVYLDNKNQFFDFNNLNEKRDILREKFKSSDYKSTKTMTFQPLSIGEEQETGQKGYRSIKSEEDKEMVFKEILGEFTKKEYVREEEYKKTNIEMRDLSHLDAEKLRRKENQEDKAKGRG